MEDIGNLERKKKTLVTGAGGFIGSHLVESLLARGHEVVCLLRRGENLRWIGEMGASLIYGDITKKESLFQPLQGVSNVYHLAGRMGGWDKPSYVYAVNYEGTKNLVEACIESGIKLDRFLFVSSVAVMGPHWRKGQLPMISAAARLPRAGLTRPALRAWDSRATSCGLTREKQLFAISRAQARPRSGVMGADVLRG